MLQGPIKNLTPQKHAILVENFFSLKEGCVIVSCLISLAEFVELQITTMTRVLPITFSAVAKMLANDKMLMKAYSHSYPWYPKTRHYHYSPLLVTASVLVHSTFTKWREFLYETKLCNTGVPPECLPLVSGACEHWSLLSEPTGAKCVFLFLCSDILYSLKCCTLIITEWDV